MGDAPFKNIQNILLNLFELLQDLKLCPLPPPFILYSHVALHIVVFKLFLFSILIIIMFTTIIIRFVIINV
jgi:hypothetical protein